jgi:hypothetical protein
MASRALGTTKQADIIEVEVAHDPRDSYGRSVIPTAKLNVTRLGLWFGWKGYESLVVDTDRTTEQGEALTIVRFTRTR